MSARLADYNQVGPDYFGVMGIPIVAGREFTRADDENRPLVAVVDETMAAKILAGKRSDRQALPSQR